MPRISSRIRSSISRRCRASRVYRGFIFGTLNAGCAAARRLSRRRSRSRSTNGSTAIPAARSRCCEANRLKFKGNWKLAYDNSGDGYHVVFSHRSLLETENRLADETRQGHVLLQGHARRAADVHASTSATATTSRTSGRISRSAPGGLWAMEVPAPRHGALRARSCARASASRPSAFSISPSSEPVNINVFPEPLAARQPHPGVPAGPFDETDAIWYGTAIVDDDGVLGGDALNDINALRMRTQEGFPNFGEVDDVANFEEIQRGLAACEDEWVYMHRGLGIPGRIDTLADGTIKAPATDEVFMREYIQRMEAADEGRTRIPYQPGAMTMSATSPITIRSHSRITSPMRFYDELDRGFFGLAARRPRNRGRGRARPVPASARAARRGCWISTVFEDWLKLFTPECVYWVPSTPDRRRPAPRDRHHVRRPAATRGPRLSPAHRLCLVAGAIVTHLRLVANVEVFRAPRYRSTHGALEFHHQRILGRRNPHAVRLDGPPLPQADGQWKISAKQVNLLDCDQCIRNPSIIL